MESDNLSSLIKKRLDKAFSRGDTYYCPFGRKYCGSCNPDMKILSQGKYLPICKEEKEEACLAAVIKVEVVAIV